MTVDFEARWERAATLMRASGMDGLFVMKPANLAYLTGDGRPCATSGHSVARKRCSTGSGTPWPSWI
jgi:Creatinase/Prolidase N-terminal domain